MLAVCASLLLLVVLSLDPESNTKTVQTAARVPVATEAPATTAEPVTTVPEPVTEAPTTTEAPAREVTKAPSVKTVQSSEPTVPPEERPQSFSGEGEHSTQASFYTEAEGTSTASGVPLDDSAFTAANRTLAFGTVIKVCRAGSCVNVSITDRGPFVGGRDLDLSRAAFVALAGGTGAGVISVTWSVVG